MIVGRQGVLFSQTETSGFVYPKADVLLAALDSALGDASEEWTLAGGALVIQETNTLLGGDDLGP